MKTASRTPRYAAALIALAASFVFDASEGNHYILPCTPECLAAADVAIGPGMTGTWFDPTQSGHGLTIEVLPGQPLQMLASWFVFGPQGGQSWIVGRGPITGNYAILEAFQMAGSGGRFPPNFDAANVHATAWGTMRFTFNDCNHGHLDWAASAPGYGSGRMNLTRLALPAGLTCQADGAGAAQGARGTP